VPVLRQPRGCTAMNRHGCHCGFIRHRMVLAAKALDSFPGRAQNHSYTNKIAGCGPPGNFPRNPTCGSFAHLAFRTSPAREFVDVD
jgi:hypothetical protein